ncbi:hypothetical protein ACSFBF_12035 [Variovorax sp. ZT5P49]|uniref:hypothetical protein n=1 Tax=Variovorax sp. ZT5P49 TaxID=3443733 RepID=UPI003F475B20
MNLPRPTVFSTVGAGREISTSGKTCSFTLNGSVGGILTYDNLYPMANGSRIVATGEYVVS